MEPKITTTYKISYKETVEVRIMGQRYSTCKLCCKLLTTQYTQYF